MQRSEDNFQELVLSFHHVNLGESHGLALSAFTHKAISLAGALVW